VPPIARVGLTEQRARQLYGPGIRVFHSPLKNSIARVMTGESTGFCKIVVRDNGKILGAHFVGPGTEEAIGSIALAMREDLGLDSLDASLYPFPSVSETIAALAARSPRRRSPLARQLARFRKLD
jgi:pyruvate/2-oxoglutarate dehydrogenase complex dihydrolipoamide dehydrogenase (E3) component